MDANIEKYTAKNKRMNWFDIYRRRQMMLVIVDICIVITAFFIALRINKYSFHGSEIVWPLAVYICLNTVYLKLFKVYSSLWTDSSDREIITISAAIIASILPIIIINRAQAFYFGMNFYVMSTLLILLATIASRITYRITRRVINHINVKTLENASRVLVVGGGSAGELIIRELYENTHLQKVPVGIIDDDKNKIGKKLHGVTILGNCNDIKRLVKEHKVEEIIFSIASIPKSRKQEIINICKETKCKLKTIPGIYEIIEGKVDVKKIRDVDIEDLLGRDEVKINSKEVSDYLENKTILVSGGGGSIGSELCRQIANFNPKKLIILDIYENSAYDIQQELLLNHGEKLNLEVVIGSVRDKKRLDALFKQYRPEVVFHAAAHKHVPLMEKSPIEAIKNNIYGTAYTAMTASKYGVKRFVLISTDKAVNPTNIMGATKRSAEMIIQSLDKKSKTEFVAVRFGNVLGSNGSVIPLFKKQIEQGGPVTVTHPEITRFFMTIPEAVSLVMQAGAMAKGGEIFVLNMGESMKILDLAKNLIELSGFEPYVDINIEFSGLRPGEKLYEEVLMKEEGLTETHHNKIFIGQQIEVDEEQLKKHFHILHKVVQKEESELIEPILKMIVPTFVRREDVIDEVSATI